MKKQSIITFFMICSVFLLIQAQITFASKPIEVTFGLGWDFMYYDVVDQKILGRTVLEQWEMTWGEPSLIGDVSGQIIDFTTKWVRLYDESWEGDPLTVPKFARASWEYTVDATINEQNGLIRLNVEYSVTYDEVATIKRTWRLVGIEGELEGIHGCGKFSGAFPSLPQFTGLISTR